LNDDSTNIHRDFSWDENIGQFFIGQKPQGFTNIRTFLGIPTMGEWILNCHVYRRRTLGVYFRFWRKYEKQIRYDKYHGDSILVLAVEIILMILESLYISRTPYIPYGY